MDTSSKLRMPTPSTLIHGVVALSGLFYTLTGVALLIAPFWFFQHIGTYPPFNRHYEGDLGAFLLPLGVALLVAARAPGRYVGVIWVAALGSALHLVNHLPDALERNTAAEWLGTVAPLTVLAAALLIVAMRLTGAGQAAQRSTAVGD